MFQSKKTDVANRLANHPDVLPHIVPKGIDVSAINPLTFDHAFSEGGSERYRFFHNGKNDDDPKASIGMLFCWTSPDVWELHMFALPEARGGDALRFATQAIEEMFFKQGAKEIWGQTPVWNERARLMHRKVGGISRGLGHQPMFGQVEVFGTSREEWMKQREEMRSR